MREIKFRFWDGNKMMEDLATTDIAIGINEVIKQWQENKDVPIKIMQFTGLKDKQGKDIYEGDIVKFISSNRFVKCLIKWNEKKMGWVASEKIRKMFFDIYTDIRLYEKNELEVIGNIYENSELLKQEKEAK